MFVGKEPSNCGQGPGIYVERLILILIMRYMLRAETPI
uniref:Uncharacterized protein n=1 Tax=Nelumbo nucifera TaxID=4432 RepID=A0A822XXB1_NELNU|nr:TPA_asm: hypothetical protein HUJ06_025119 [Nelumbo nucifera]